MVVHSTVLKQRLREDLGPLCYSHESVQGSGIQVALKSLWE